MRFLLLVIVLVQMGIDRKGLCLRGVHFEKGYSPDHHCEDDGKYMSQVGLAVHQEPRPHPECQTVVQKDDAE